MTEDRFFRLGTCGVGLIAYHEFVNIGDPIALTWMALILLYIGLEDVISEPSDTLDSVLQLGALIARFTLFIMTVVVMLDFLINY